MNSASFGVFVSYRRDDASGYAGRLQDSLADRFGASSVFIDVDSIEPGVDFIDAIEGALAQCRVVLALIGPQWLEATDAAGRRRLDQSDDFVRREIALALANGLRVIPLLVRGARMPGAPELPAVLEPLARCQALELSDRLWRESVASLLDLLEPSLTDRTSRGEPRPLPTGEAVPLPSSLAVARSGPFAGRDEPMATMRDSWTRARSTGPLFVGVAGEPGIGKTRLVAEFAASARGEGATVLAGRCTEEPLRPYEPFADLLLGYGRCCEGEGDPLAVRLRALAEPLGPLLPASVARSDRISTATRGGAFDATGDRAATFDAFVDVVARICTGGPAVMVLEDLHWATAPTLLLLRHLLGSNVPLPVLLVGTYRDTELDRMHPFAATLADLRSDSRHGRIMLRGLDEYEIAEYVAEQHPADGADQLARDLHEQTDGNPFFVGEILRSLAEDPGDRRLSEGIREVVGRRLARLPESVTRALRAAAVIGPTFALRLLEAVPAAAEDPDELIDALDNAISARLIVEEPGAPGLTYAFAHALVRQTLYEELSTARRTRLHGQVVEAIEHVFADHEDWLPSLAYHAAESARAGEVHRALDYARRAAQAATNRLAFEEAAAIARRGIELAELDPTARPDTTAELLYLLWDALTYLPNVTEEELRACADDALRAARASDHPDCIARAATAVLWSTGTTTAQGDDPENEQLIQHTLQSIGSRRSPASVEFLAFAGNYYVDAANRRVDGDRLIEDALLRARELGDQRALGTALEWAIQTHWGTPTRAEQAALIEELRGVCEAADNPLLWSQYYGDVVNFAIMQADPDVRLHVTRFEESLPGKERQWSSYALYASGFVALLDGDFSRAEQCNEAGLSDARGSGYIATGLAQLFFLRREQGRLDEIEPIAEQALQMVPGLAGFRAALALARLELGKTNGIAEDVTALAADDFAAVGRDQTWPVSLFLFAELSIRLDDPALARRTLAALSPFGGQLIAAGICAVAVGAVDRGLGQCVSVLGDHEAGEVHFRNALELEERVTSPPLAARTKFWFARALLGRGGADNAAHAHALLDDVIDTTDRLGMQLLGAEARALRAGAD
jgi:hypothetical protein